MSKTGKTMRFRRTLLSILLSTALAVTMFPGFGIMGADAFATDNDAAGAQNKTAPKLTLNKDDPFDYTSLKAKRELLKDAEDMPETFDLRNVNGKSYVTPVKLQNPFGSCWGFAAIGAAETSILGNPLLNDPNDPTYSLRVGMKADSEGKDQDGKEILDLSEKHLALFASSYLDDPADPQNGEGTHHEKEATASDILNIGGNPVLATNTFAAGLGPNLENRTDPNNIDPETGEPASMKELLTYKGKPGNTEIRHFDGAYRDFGYSKEDDWSIDKDYRFYQSFVLKQSYMLPEPAQLGENAETYAYNPAGTAAIKQQLLEKRGVEIGFLADTSSPNQELGEDGKFLSTKNWAHYTWTPSFANHAVEIIGWDDNYPRENFVAGHQPPVNMFPDGKHEGATNGGNGAWLVKNSWGSGEEAFPNKGEGSWGLLRGQDKAPYKAEDDAKHTGYFWISYYDKSISMPEALEFDRANVDSYVLDQMDYMQVHELLASRQKKETKMANVFTADRSETLEQISCMTTYPGTEVTYEVYLLNSYFQNPEHGVKVATIEPKTYEYGGFHKEGLDEPVLIQKGQSYSIVVTQKENGKYVVNTPVGRGKDSSVSMWDVGIINKQESYVFLNGEWQDYSNKDIQKKLFKDPDHPNPVFDNFPIKGFCKETGRNLSVRLTKDLVTLPIFRDMTETIKVRFTGSGAEDLPEDLKIDWKLIDEKGSEEPMVFLETSKGGSEVKLTPNYKSGIENEGLLTVTVKNIGTTVIQVHTFKFAPSIINFVNKNGKTAPVPQVYTGKAFKPEVTVWLDDPYFMQLKENEEYTLSYRKNIKCGAGEVKATGVGEYMEHAGITEFFPIVPAKAKINNLVSKKKSLTVKVKDQKASGITGYQMRYRVKGTSKWKTKKFKAGKASYTLKGLKAGKRYQVQVRGYVNIPLSKQGWSMKPVYYGEYSPTKASKAIKKQ